MLVIYIKVSVFNALYEYCYTGIAIKPNILRLILFVLTQILVMQNVKKDRFNFCGIPFVVETCIMLFSVELFLESQAFSKLESVFL
jgi:hypothetical protein